MNNRIKLASGLSSLLLIMAIICLQYDFINAKTINAVFIIPSFISSISILIIKKKKNE